MRAPAVRKVLATASFAAVLALPAYAAAEEASPPTTIDVEKTAVVATSIDVRTTRDVETVDRDKNDDDDDGNAGLWGLLGLVGLLGLAGLAGLRRNRDDGYGTSARISGDTTPRGSTSTDR